MTAASDRGDSPTPGFSDVVHVWERHDDEDYRRDLSHWRGQGRWHEARWLRLGSTLVGACTTCIVAWVARFPRGSRMSFSSGARVAEPTSTCWRRSRR